MRLIRIHIENFGKLSNYNLDLTANPTVILKDNGWGKSTLAAFIKVMFYGFEGENKREPAEREREKYRPWNRGLYGGTIVYEVDGKQYEINKVFGQKEKEDSCVLCDAQTRLNIMDEDAAHLGLKLFSLDEKSFQRSVFIAQNDVSVYEEGREQIEDGISAKIGNLSDATDDVNRYDAVMIRLNDMLNKMSPKRATGSIKQMDAHISSLQNAVRNEDVILKNVRTLEERLQVEKANYEACLRKRETLEQDFRQNAKKGELLARRDAFQQLWKKYEASRESLLRMEESFVNGLPTDDDINAQLSAWDERAELLNEIKRRQTELDYEYKAIEERKHQEAEIRQLEQEKKLLEEDKKFRKRMGGIVLISVGVVLLAAGIAIGAVFKYLMIGIAISVAAVACIVSGLIVIPFGHIDDDEEEEENAESEVTAEQPEDNEQTAFFKNEINRMNDRIAIIETNVQEFFRHYEVNYLPDSVESSLYDAKQKIGLYQAKIDEVEGRRSEIKAFENENDMTAIMNADNMKDMEEEISNQRQQNEISMKKSQDLIREYENHLEEEYEKLQILAETQEELRHDLIKRDEKRHQYDMLTYTRDYMKKAKEQFTSKYRKPLLDGFKKYYSMLSDDEVSEFEIDANIRMTKREYGEAHSVSQYSSGNRDMIDICLRMALIDAMYQEEKPFIILDDPFVNLDREKTNRALHFLGRISEGYQVIYFTCHESRARRDIND